MHTTKTKEKDKKTKDEKISREENPSQLPGSSLCAPHLQPQHHVYPLLMTENVSSRLTGLNSLWPSHWHSFG